LVTFKKANLEAVTDSRVRYPEEALSMARALDYGL